MVTLLVTLALTGSASASGVSWTFFDAAGFHHSGVGTDILGTIVANKEYAKFSVDTDGVQHFILGQGCPRSG